MRTPAALFVGLFAFYLLTGSREPPWNDAKPIHEVAESLVYRGSVAVETRWPYSAPNGRDGKLYSAAPILPSLIHVPGVLVHHAIVKAAGLSAWETGRMLGSHVGPAACGALVCLLFFQLCRRLGLASVTAYIGTLALGLGTGIFVYARSPFSEIVQAACFLGFFARVLEVGERPERNGAAWLGIWAGLLVNTKLVFFLSWLGAAAFLAVRLRHRPRTELRALAAAVPGLLLGVALVLGYNHLRWGSPLATGYDLVHQDPFRERLAVGLWGMAASPGKSVFLYHPPLLLALLGALRAVRKRPDLGWALALLAAPVVLLHAKLIWWSGDWAWGPRYVLFAVPVLLLLACVAFDGERRRLTVAAAAALALVGVAVQTLGNAFYWDHYLRIAQEARTQWLGAPNRGGSLPWRGQDACDPCFEDLSPFIWMPPFQPIQGHLWLLRNIGKDAAAAEADAPWRRYTSLRLDIRKSYARVRLDWWFLDLRPRFPVAAWILLVLLLGATVGPLVKTRARIP